MSGVLMAVSSFAPMKRLMPLPVGQTLGVYQSSVGVLQVFNFDCVNSIAYSSASASSSGATKHDRRWTARWFTATVLRPEPLAFHLTTFAVDSLHHSLLLDQPARTAAFYHSCESHCRFGYEYPPALPMPYASLWFCLVVRKFAQR